LLSRGETLALKLIDLTDRGHLHGEVEAGRSPHGPTADDSRIRQLKKDRENQR
jgi:hypothetical protein